LWSVRLTSGIGLTRFQAEASELLCQLLKQRICQRAVVPVGGKWLPLSILAAPMTSFLKPGFRQIPHKLVNVEIQGVDVFNG
jgi:hypothetical protein